MSEGTAAAGGEPRRLRAASRAGFAIAALAVVLAPWYRLDDYVPNGWDATWWARLALLASLLGLVLASMPEAGRIRIALAAVAVAAIAFRLAVVPDFGFGFDGLDVPVARRWGLFVALGVSIVATAATAAPSLEELGPQELQVARIAARAEQRRGSLRVPQDGRSPSDQGLSKAGHPLADRTGPHTAGQAALPTEGCC